MFTASSNPVVGCLTFRVQEIAQCLRTVCSQGLWATYLYILNVPHLEALLQSKHIMQ